jgi:hypothetical protein
MQIQNLMQRIPHHVEAALLLSEEEIFSSLEMPKRSQVRHIWTGKALSVENNYFTIAAQHVQIEPKTPTIQIQLYTQPAATTYPVVKSFKYFSH